MSKFRRILFYCVSRLLALLALVVIAVYLTRAIDARSMQPLKAEHRAEFTGEFRAEQESQTDWQAYRELEDRLALEADRIFADRPPGHDRLDRHAVGSVSNPDEHAVNWNRSYKLAATPSKGAAVLVHGLSDSPYSVRATAELMQSKGITAYAPRMPGHGFAVGDLRHASWEDWMAAIRIAVRAADAERKPGQPLFLAGYSNGGLLAVRYALDCETRDDMPCPDGILLLSPAIDVTAFASLGRWHRAISWTSYFEQFQWDTIMPEVDPYKFTSFPKNPGRELYAAARQVKRDLESVPSGAPPLLAFQSAVDDTVSTEAVIDLFRKWPSNGSELVLYDVNRSNRTATLMVPPPDDIVRDIEAGEPLEYTVTIVTNRNADSQAVQAVHYNLQSQQPTRQDLDLTWPATVFSLSHIAIPFQPDDPVYGIATSDNPLNLGGIAPKGERNVLSLSPNYFARLRYNPFYAYQEDKISEWLDRWVEAENQHNVDREEFTTHKEPRASSFPLQPTEASSDEQLKEGWGHVSSVFGLPLVDPYDTYQAHIDDAKSGNAEAQYQVSSVLFECKGLPTQSYLDALVRDGTFTEAMGEETQVRLDVCRELIDKTEKDELDSWKEWLKLSAIQGHPLALARDLVFSPGNYSIEQARRIASVVVRTPGPEKYPLIASYFANYREDDRIGYEAWMRLSCNNIPGCSIEKYLDDSIEPLRPNELHQVTMLVENIESAIGRRAWDEIHF